MNINKPLSIQELKQGDLIPKGIYKFEILNAEDTISKSGNDMIKLQIKIWLEDGRERIVFDYLLEALEYKLGHFADVVGLMDQYNSKTLNSYDCIGKCGSVKIGIQVDKSGQYPDKNIVVDYITTPVGSLMKPLPDVKDNFLNDSIPF
jgi:hypothetical protein